MYFKIQACARNINKTFHTCVLIVLCLPFVGIWFSLIWILLTVRSFVFSVSFQSSNVSGQSQYNLSAPRLLGPWKLLPCILNRKKISACGVTCSAPPAWRPLGDRRSQEMPLRVIVTGKNTHPDKPGAAPGIGGLQLGAVLGGLTVRLFLFFRKLPRLLNCPEHGKLSIVIAKLET